MDNENNTQLKQILNIIKVSSLALPAIAFLQYYAKVPAYQMSLMHEMVVTVILIMILLVYSLWIYLQSKITNKTIIKSLIDPIISLSITLLSVLLTGSYKSSYKFLFIFVILFTSIECGRRTSLIIALLSATLVLGIDLVAGAGLSVNTYFEDDIVLAFVFLIIAWTLGYYDNIRKNHIAYLRKLANIDGLTKLYNHRYFYDLLSMQIVTCEHKNVPLSLLFIDIDDFKFYNDTFGHQKGDEVLRNIASIMETTLPQGAFIARYGGEEFVAILPDYGEDAAVREAENLRKTVQSHPFDGQENLPGNNVTISVGVSTYPTKARTDAELIKGADDACYKAKFLCKNRVEAYFSILDEFHFGQETITQIKTLIAVINAKDKYTYRHVERVVFYCSLLADQLMLSPNDKRDLIYAAYLHDIGKINIAEEILVKTEPLTTEEWNTLKNHPQYAVDIIKNNKVFAEIKPIILQHHERYDGKGYPCGLKDGKIHYLARLLIVVDAFDAMTSLRPYQKTKTYYEAMNELVQCSGTQFDPEAVQAFVHCMEKRNGNVYH